MKYNEWLSNIPINNPFSILTEMEDESIGITATPTEKQQPKPPPIYIEAQIIEPLLELMKSIANDKYTLKQLKDYQVKVQVNTSEIYRKLTLALKEKNANFYTCQLKKNKSYRIVLRGVHPRTSTSSIINELKRHNHQVRKINNIVKHDTKQLSRCFTLNLNLVKTIKKFTKLIGYLILLFPLNLLEIKETFRNAYAVSHTAIPKIIAKESRHVLNAQGFTGIPTVLLERKI